MVDASSGSAPVNSPNQITIQSLPLDKIYTSPHQMRREFDENSLRDLARSMKQEGLIQPITVRPVGSAYELIAGERRLRAAQLLKWETIPARIIEVNDEDAAIKGLIENLQRSDLNPVEEARGLKQLTEPPYKLTQEAIAQRIGRSQTAVARCLALLELPEEIQDLIPKGVVTESHTRCLRKISDRAQQIALAQQADKEKWSVKETERRVHEWLKANGQPVNRRQSERRVLENVLAGSDTDPLADLWKTLETSNGTSKNWKVRYEGSGQWTFQVKASSPDPKSTLGDFFIRLGNTLNSPLPKDLSLKD